MKKLIRALMIVASLLLAAQTVSFSAEPVENWKQEFDTVCGQLDNGMELSVDELKKGIENCDRLKPRLESLEPSPRKLYLKRLQMCRNLYVYLLENKLKGK